MDRPYRLPLSLGCLRLPTEPGDSRRERERPLKLAGGGDVHKAPLARWTLLAIVQSHTGPVQEQYPCVGAPPCCFVCFPTLSEGGGVPDPGSPLHSAKHHLPDLVIRPRVRISAPLHLSVHVDI